MTAVTNNALTLELLELDWLVVWSSGGAQSRSQFNSNDS